MRPARRLAYTSIADPACSCEECSSKTSLVISYGVECSAREAAKLIYDQYRGCSWCPEVAAAPQQSRGPRTADAPKSCAPRAVCAFESDSPTQVSRAVTLSFMQEASVIRQYLARLWPVCDALLLVPMDENPSAYVLAACSETFEEHLRAKHSVDPDVSLQGVLPEPMLDLRATLSAHLPAAFNKRKILVAQLDT